MGNKIKYNLKNVHAAKLSREEDGSYTYARTLLPMWILKKTKPQQPGNDNTLVPATMRGTGYIYF